MLKQPLSTSNSTATGLVTDDSFRLLVDSVSDYAIVILDPLGHVVSWNNGAQRIKGYRAEEILGKDFACFYPTDAMQRGVPQQELKVAAKEGRFEDEGWRVRKDGSQFWASVVITSLRDKDGTLRGFGKVTRDLTERKQAEVALRLSLKDLDDIRAALDEHAIVAMVDPRGKITFVNDKFCTLSKYSREELLGQDHRLINSGFHPKEFIRDLWTTISQGRVWHGEIRNRAKDGSFYWVDTTIVPFLNEDETPRQYVAIRADITERKRADDALRDSRQRLEQYTSDLTREVAERTQELHKRRQEAEAANQAKSDFLATMSHEIRTPMNAILGTAQILERGQLNADQQHLVGTIRTAGRSLLGIINNVLDLSKIEAGHFELEQHPFVLRNVLSNLIDVLTPTATSKGLVLTLAPLPEGIDALIGDAQRLGQVLYNLTGNAIKFTANGQVTVSVALQSALTGQVALRFAVRDTGIGIAVDQIERIFDAFIQAAGATQRQYGGTGLGLAISRQLVTLMGGEISVASHPGEGSEFSFVLMMEAVEAVASIPEKAPATAMASGLRLAGLHLLVVDDSTVNQDVARRLLALEGATCETADDGRQAVERLRTGPGDFDVVLMDIQMPEMDGLDATQALRSELGLSSLPVIALTAAALPSQRERAVAAGMNDFIAKPFELDTMVAIILRHMRSQSRRPTAPVLALLPASPSRTSAEGFPEIPGVDSQRAALRLLGDRKLFLSALRALRDEFVEAPAETRADLARADRDRAARRMHKLLGVAGNLSAETVAEVAGQLETALRQSPAQDFEPQLEALAKALNEVIGGLPADIDAPPSEESAAGDGAHPDISLAAVQALITALADGDMRALKHYDALRAGLAAWHGAAEVARLTLAVDNLRFAEASTQLRTWYPQPSPWKEHDVA